MQQGDASLLAVLGFGFVLGLKHALDADHLVAVSTIVGREKSIWKSSLVGALWGVGHTASLFVAAILVILLRVTISETVALTLEFGVGVMLMVLGADLLRRVLQGEISVHSHTHEHGGESHSHVHLHAKGLELPEQHHAIGRKPFYVGLVHGLAGSAALMLFVLTTISSPWAGLLYVVIFGAGTIAGMLVMSALIGLPFTLASRLLTGLVGRIQFAAGLGSVGFGIFYAWHVAFREGLLSSLMR
jgi:ABC-type nickel/cobalt efflux system permease component RcnA